MRSLTPPLIAFALAACGGTGENIDAEGCTGLEDGPFVAITAGTVMDATAPAIEASTGAYTVTLPAAGPGYLSFNSTDDTEYAVFADRELAVAAFTPSGTEIPRSAKATSSSVCTAIKSRYIIELPVGPFFFALGPDAGAVLSLVLRPYNPD
jgi:hypothetical protein